MPSLRPACGRPTIVTASAEVTIRWELNEKSVVKKSSPRVVVYVREFSHTLMEKRKSEINKSFTWTKDIEKSITISVRFSENIR